MRKRRTIKSIDLTNPRHIKLSISVGIFLALALIRLFDPKGAAHMGSAVDEYIGDRTPVTIEALGKAVTDGDNLVAVFQNLSDVLTGKPKEVVNEANIDPPAIEEDEQQQPAEPSNSPEPSMSSSEFQTTELISRSLPWRERELVSEGELLSGGDFGVDDTLPLPFGYDAPPNVDYAIYEFTFDSIKPVEGVESSGFGYRMHPLKNEELFHYGTDFAANKGTNIQAFAAGTVAAAGYSATYGNYLLINHKDGVSSFYAHCSKLLVKSGATVKLGQKVAQVGSTGLSTGSHLHFELRRDGKILNPEYYI